MVTNTGLPIVVEPFEATSPIEANEYTKSPVMVTNIDLPIVVEAQNDNQIWFINYGQNQQGLVKNEHEVEAPYFKINVVCSIVYVHPPPTYSFRA